MCSICVSFMFFLSFHLFHLFSTDCNMLLIASSFITVMFGRHSKTKTKNKHNKAKHEIGHWIFSLGYNYCVDLPYIFVDVVVFVFYCVVLDVSDGRLFSRMFCMHSIFTSYTTFQQNTDHNLSRDRLNLVLDYFWRQPKKKKKKNIEIL